MTKKILLLALAALASFQISTQASITINNFSSLVADGATFSFTWAGAGTQEISFYTIGPSATNQGSFSIAPTSWESGFDLTQGGILSGIALTARFNPGNAVSSVYVEFTDSNFEVASGEFSGFTSEFSTVTVDFSSFSSSNPFDFSSITSWGISGGSLTGGSDVRVSFDNIAAVPEPSSALLLGLGAAGVYFLRRRQKQA